jgi:nitroreductase
VRRFKAEPVKEDDLRAMLEAARLAPSSHNAQPWHFIVIRSSKLRAKLKEAVNDVINATGGDSYEDEHPNQRFYATSVFDAPLVIAALTFAVPSPVPKAPPKLESGLLSTAVAIAHLNLAAVSLGYGGCWSTLPLSWARAQVEALLEVKEPWCIVAFLSVGIPEKMPKDVSKKPIEEIVSFL